MRKAGAKHPRGYSDKSAELCTYGGTVRVRVTGIPGGKYLWNRYTPTPFRTHASVGAFVPCWHTAKRLGNLARRRPHSRLSEVQVTGGAPTNTKTRCYQAAETPRWSGSHRGAGAANKEQPEKAPARVQPLATTPNTPTVTLSPSPKENHRQKQKPPHEDAGGATTVSNTARAALHPYEVWPRKNQTDRKHRR